MEGIPVALMEALACALPVVATALSGIPELVREGETGWLVPPADPAALAEALAKVWAEPERSARLAGAGRDLVLREFDLQTNVQQLSALFTQVIQARAIPLQPRITQFTLGEHQTQNRFYRL
jgi:glycosyltransferase involved in cell wall biosynthesis